MGMLGVAKEKYLQKDFLQVKVVLKEIGTWKICSILKNSCIEAKAIRLMLAF